MLSQKQRKILTYRPIGRSCYTQDSAQDSCADELVAVALYSFFATPFALLPSEAWDDLKEIWRNRGRSNS